MNILDIRSSHLAKIDRNDYIKISRNILGLN